MLPDPDTTLGRLFARLRNWMSLAEFEQALAEYFNGERSIDGQPDAADLLA
jgi:hypothetical protein